ncbi:MAG: hypothetical protein FH756_17375 [Firmicutes bacterium]|nr:hypothetical protein [Bacillota bacterium]
MIKQSLKVSNAFIKVNRGLPPCFLRRRYYTITIELIGVLITLTKLICSILAAGRTAQILEELKEIKKALGIDVNQDGKLFADRLEEMKQQHNSESDNR